MQAYPENAFDNGVRFLLSNKVTGITTEGGKVKTVQTTGMTAPFHKGAAKYFAEKGVSVESK